MDKIGKNLIAVVELHHHVLRPWSVFGGAELVVSLDHHTDVERAFRDPRRQVACGEWRDPAKVEEAIGELRHDEHFDWAIQSGLVRSARIVSHVNATIPASEKLVVCCDDAWPEENAQLGEPEKFRPLADAVLESSFLAARLGRVPEERYLLDIDCDYFLTERALRPADSGFFHALIRGAGLISVSLEADWVRLLRLPGEKLDAQFIVASLYGHFREALQ